MYKTMLTMVAGLVLVSVGMSPVNAEDPVAIEGVEMGTANGSYKEYICEAPSTIEGLVVDPENAFPARCDHGTFVRDSIGLSHGFSLVPWAEEQWTGRFQSVIDHTNGEHVFEIVFDNGEIVESGTQSGSTWPPLNSEFTHECLAFDVDTDLPIAWHGFGCNISGPLVPA